MVEYSSVYELRNKKKTTDIRLCVNDQLDAQLLYVTRLLL